MVSFAKGSGADRTQRAKSATSRNEEGFDNGRAGTVTLVTSPNGKDFNDGLAGTVKAEVFRDDEGLESK